MEDHAQQHPHGSTNHSCGDCAVLTEALRDIEQQRREAEDEHLLKMATSTNRDAERLSAEDDLHQRKLNKLLRRRDCALEVLLKHQSLEHRF